MPWWRSKALAAPASGTASTCTSAAGRRTSPARDVAVIVVGTDIDLRAKGKGWAYLQGRGYYFVNGFGPFPWNERGGFAAVDDGAADPPPEAE